jgi:hypothetical protein
MSISCTAEPEIRTADGTGTLAEVAAAQGRLQVGVARVVTTHETDRDQPAAELNLCRHYPDRAGHVGSQRLLAQHGLAGREAGQHELLVRLVRRRDQHRIDRVVLDQHHRVVEDPSAARGGDGLGSLRVDVEHRRHLAA